MVSLFRRIFKVKIEIYLKILEVFRFAKMSFLKTYGIPFPEKYDEDTVIHMGELYEDWMVTTFPQYFKAKAAIEQKLTNETYKEYLVAAKKYFHLLREMR